MLIARSNLNMLIARPYETSYLMTIVMFELFITVCEIFTVEMYMTLTLALTFRMDQGQIGNMPIER